MRIGIDGRYIQDYFPGIGRYTYNLIGGLAGVVQADTVVVIHNPALPNTRYDIAALGALPHVELVETAARTFSLSEQHTLPALARRLKLDIWHAPYYISPYRMPCPLVVTIHDSIASRYPQYLPSLAARLTYEAAMRLALTAARRVVADSRASRDDLLRFFAVPPAKLSVVYAAADPHYVPQPAEKVAALRVRLGLPDSYVLYLGINKPHKNVTTLVQAWQRAMRNVGMSMPAQLVIGGREDPRFPLARQLAEQLGLGASVRFLGDVAEADLPALYSGAALFVFPSLYEGFGLPVLEAMACGIPVICSTAPSLLEIAGDAALTVDPLDVDGFADRMVRVLSDAALRRELSQRGSEQAARFSWQRAASEILKVYQEAVR